MFLPLAAAGAVDVAVVDTAGAVDTAGNNGAGAIQ